MASDIKNLSHVKLNIKQIIDNLEKLNNSEDRGKCLENLKTTTEQLLNKLENLPLKRLKRNNIKKSERRKRLKLLRKLNKKDSGTSAKIKNVAEVSSISINNQTVLRKTEQKNNHKFRSIKECKRFLQNFELLEQLHLLRACNSTETYKFALKLRQLKSIWNCLLQDKLQEQTSRDVAIQQQWNEVLFGPPEKTYFHEKPNLQDFIRKRQVWDSYINNKYGSPIPIGWIVPPAEVNEQWRPYLVTTNNEV